MKPACNDNNNIFKKEKKATTFPLPGSVKHETNEEDDEEMVGVPEDFEIAASDDLHGGGDDEDEGQSDDDPCETSDGGEHEVGWSLLRILRPEKKRVTTWTVEAERDSKEDVCRFACLISRKDHKSHCVLVL